MPEPTDETLAQWLADVTTDAVDVKQYQTVLTHVLAKVNGPRVLDLVGLAHDAGDETAVQWFTSLAREKKDDFIVGRNGALVARLAATAVVKSLAAGSKLHVAVGLATQCAAFVGLEPALPEVTTFADAALRAAAAEARRREGWETVAPIVDELLEGTAEVRNPETNVVEREEDDGHEGAIRRLAEAVDLLGATLDQRLNLVDEEYDSLWWSYTAQSESNQTPWGDVTPLGRRVVLIADELGRKVSRTPAPPIVPGLIGLALDDKRDKNVSLQEVAKYAVSEGALVVPDAQHRLLPVSSAVAEARRLGGEDETLWPKSLKAATRIDSSRTTTALAAAIQLIRENQIGGFLV